jgi:hypothetical protein
MAFEFELTIQVTLDSTVMHILTMVGCFSVMCVCVCVLFDLGSFPVEKRCRLHLLRRLFSNYTLSAIKTKQMSSLRKENTNFKS